MHIRHHIAMFLHKLGLQIDENLLDLIELPPGRIQAEIDAYNDADQANARMHLATMYGVPEYVSTEQLIEACLHRAAETLDQTYPESAPHAPSVKPSSSH